MTSFIKVPFASSGDKAAVPDADAGGGVNMTQGYGQAYSLDPATDPSAKRIERDKMNWLFNRITQAINEIQSGGVAPFITSVDNGGSAFSYGKGALVSLGGVVYQSLVASNTSTPPGANWSALPEKMQPLDTTLTALAGLVGAANKLPYFNGNDTAALTDFTAFARTLLARSDADSVLSDLGLIVTDVGKNIISAPAIVDVLSYLGITTALDGKQPLDATLTALASLVGTADKLPYFNGADTAALTDLTAYARGLLGAPNAADSRSYLGLKSAATKDVGNGAGQVPDMSSWVSGGSPTTGWRKTPDGFIEQWGLTGATTTDVTINFPIPFPTALISINEHDMAPSGESMSMWQLREVTLSNCVAVNLGTLIRGNPSLGSPVVSGCRWFAKGV